jgi:hypothetical protein
VRRSHVAPASTVSFCLLVRHCCTVACVCLIPYSSTAISITPITLHIDVGRAENGVHPQPVAEVVHILDARTLVYLLDLLR